MGSRVEMKLPMHLICIITSLFLSNSWSQAQVPAVYNIDAAKSRIELAVHRAGLLKVAGHDHVIEARKFSGEVRFDSRKVADSSVSLKVEAGSLIVLDPDTPEKDREEVQATMLGAQVLDTKEFHEILFHSTKVSYGGRTTEDLTLTGKLTLHGIEKEIAFPVHIHVEQNLLRASGTVTIAQTDFGIKPIIIGLGMIRVADKVRVDFNLLAERANP
jgi:polyisoprenoid-binding protein YceI